MAIGRVPGAALLSDLDRQGADIRISSDGQSLIQFDVTNYRVGINTITPQQALEVVGNVLVTSGNILTSANLTYDIGSTSNHWRSIYAANITSANIISSNISATTISGTLTSASQTNITAVGTLSNLTVSGNITAQSSILPTSNIAGNIGDATYWWDTIFANTVISTNVYGTIQTGNQPYITNLGNISIGNIVSGNSILVTGDIGGANVNATLVSAANVDATYVGGTLTTAPQTNITAVGTLTSLAVSGNAVVQQYILPTSNVTGSIGSTNVWWEYLYANTAQLSNLTAITGNFDSVTGTILTANQPNITNLGNITVDSITIGGNISITGNTTTGVIYADEIYEANNRVLTSDSTFTVTGQAYGTGNVANIALTLANTTVVAGQYGSTTQVAQVTFDSAGRATSAANLILTQLGNLTVADTTISTVAGDIQLNSNVANISVTSDINANNLIITSDVNAARLYDNNNRVLTDVSTVNVTGDITGNGNVSNISLTLVDTGVTAGVYGSADDEYADYVPKITVDSKGRITNIANVTLTQVGNVSFIDTTISTTSNLTLAPTDGYIFANNSVISSVADPVSLQDAVTLAYLNTQLNSTANYLLQDDSSIYVIDDNTGRVEITVDGNLVANIDATATEFYTTVNIGNLTINNRTISSNGNIILNAQNTGVVQIAGNDAMWIPSGNTSVRPLEAERGYIRYNTDFDAIEYYDGNTWTYPGAATITSDTIEPDGISNTFTLSSSGATTEGILVSINGTLQRPSISYVVANDEITFTEIPLISDIIEVRYMASGAITVQGLSYGTTEVLLSTGNVNVTGNIIPTANITYDLGSETNWWKDLYISGATIHMGAAQLKVIDNSLSFVPAGETTPINISTSVDPTILYAGSSNIKVTNDYVNVAIASTNVAAFSSEGLTITGNVSADYIIGDGSQLTGLPAGYTDADVEAYLPNYTGNISSLTTANTAMKDYVDGISSTKAELSGATFTGNITVTDSIMSNYITANVLRTTDTTIALGPNAGTTDQGLSAIAIGWNAGANTQSYYAVAIGPQAGQTQQGEYAVAIGRESAKTSQGADSVAIGRIAGETSQGTTSVAVGFGAARNYQSNNAVAIGNSAGGTYQGNSAVAIGNSSGLLYQGNLAIAIGYRAGYSYQAANTIILNATGTTINGVENQTDSFYVNPIRNATGNVGLLQYNSTTKEVTYSLDIAANSISANTYTWANGTSIITTLSSDITTANTAMKGYVDAINSTLTANASTQASTLATIQNTYAQLSGATFTGALAAPNLALTTALAITSGGTGGTSASEALNNLLPSGEVSGYVLKTSGPGTYYWSTETGSGSTIGTSITTSRTFVTATAGQTVFTGVGTYTPGAGQLRIYINGVRQFDSAYTETNSSAFTLSSGVSSGAVVLAEIDAYTDFTSYASDVVVSPVGTISSTTVQDALAELDTEKAALAGAAFTGNVTTTGNVSITSTLRSNSSSTGALVVTGGVGVGGNLYIGGNLQVAGNVTYFDSNNVTFNDAMIYLADDNTGDVLDIGFVSSFTNPGYQHTGFVRDATDGTWKLFANVVAEPGTTVDFTNAIYSNLRIGNLTSIGGTFTGNVGAGNISATNLTGTLTTAAQTNITSLGTLSALTVSGAPVPNANVSVNLGSTSAWWSILYANTHVGSTATFSGNITAGNVSATNLSGSITSSQVTTALGYTPYNSTNPSGYTTNTGTVTSVTGSGTVSGLTLTGTVTSTGNLTLGGTLSLTSGQVTTALGFTPYNATNPSGYISAVPNSNTQVSSLGVGVAFSGVSGEIRAGNNITAYYSSDSRLKENVRDIPNALDKVTAIGGKLFDWTDEYVANHGGLDDYFMRKADFGVIAQDVAQVLPEAVRTREDGYLAVDYEKMCALAFAAIKELQQQVKDLEQQLKGK